MTLSKTESLIIRLCKGPTKYRSLRNFQRAVGIHCLMHPEHIGAVEIIHWLHDIVEKCGLIKDYGDLIFRLSDRYDYNYSKLKGHENIDEYHHRVITRLISIIRLAEVSKLPGYIPTKKFQD